MHCIIVGACHRASTVCINLPFFNKIEKIMFFHLTLMSSDFA